MEKIPNFIPVKFPQVAAVEASAGSGKTYALAKRFLQLLISKKNRRRESLNTILAITFTNKAAYEMKERIMEILKKLALDSFSCRLEKKDILDCLEVDYSFARAKAAALIEEIISDYTFFQVKTIDSFINYLLLGCALHIRRSAAFSIERNYSRQLLYALDCLIDKALFDKKIKGDFDDFIRHYLFLENKPGWFPKNKILSLFELLFELSNCHGKNFSYSKISTDVLFSQKKNTYNLIKQLAADLPPGLNKASSNMILKFISRQKPVFNLNSLPKSFAGLPPLNKNCLPSRQFLSQWQKIQQAIKKIAEIEAEVAYRPYVKLFNQVLGVFDSFSESEDTLFLNQLNSRARFLFSDAGVTVAEVYYRLATRLRHYLIDEFQDTSFLQWDNLKPMVEESLASGGTFFYVGDKKQAIYRFRGGQSSLFDQVKSDFSAYSPESLTLNQNWRSQKEIVEFNNSVFSSQNLWRFFKNSPIFDELNQEGCQEIVANFSASKQSYREKNCFGYVSLKTIKADSQSRRNEIMRQELISLVGELRKRFNLGDIALLVRDNREAELLTSWLLEENLAPESEKTLNVLEHPRIKEVISFLKFIYSPVDDLNFAAFILSSLFLKKAGLKREKISDFLFQLSPDDYRFSLYRKFSQEFFPLWQELIEPFFKSAGFICPYELLTWIYDCFAVFENFPKSQAFFKKFLQVCLESQEKNSGLWGLLAFIAEPETDKLYLDLAAKDAVKILTIHKAKGLEFPAVIAPFLRMDTSFGGNSGFYLNQKESSRLGLLRITKQQKNYSQKLKSIYRQNFKQNCLDQLNAIYVALTRAKEELYLFLPDKSGRGLNLAPLLFENEKSERGKKQSYFYSKPSCGSQLALSGKQKRKPFRLSEEFSFKPGLKESLNAQEGVIFHQILAALGNLAGKNPAKCLEAALSQAKKVFAVEDVSFYRQKIKKMLAAKALQELFFQPRARVFNEKEVIDSRGNLKRIDRLLVFKDKVVIVEYKLSRRLAEASLSQLKTYRDIVAQVYPGKKIQAFTVFIYAAGKKAANF